MNEEELKKGCGKVALQVGWNRDYCDGRILCKECEARLDGFQKGKLQERKRIMERIEGLDDMFLRYATMGYSEKGDTWTILKQDWNKIVKELQKEIGGVKE